MKNRKPNTATAAVSTPAEVVTSLQAPAVAAPAQEAVASPAQEALPVLEASTVEAAPKKAQKVKKEKKTAVKAPKLVRDSFTMPESDYATLAALKQRARLAGVHAKKSQLLLAGLKALAAFPDNQFLDVVGEMGAQKAAHPG